MKLVVKGSAPQMFIEWKESGNDNWTPTYKNLQNPQKRALHESLIQEQAWVCCYCGRSIALENSHIEHFRPQRSPWEELSLCYVNMHTSCVREGKHGEPLHCGHAKGDKFSESLHISPLDPACEQRFTYTLDGGIVGTQSGDQSAEYMLKLLRLDVPLLRGARREVITRTFDNEFLRTATEEQIAKLRDAYRKIDSNGHAQSLGHVLARFAEQQI